MTSEQVAQRIVEALEACSIGWWVAMGATADRQDALATIARTLDECGGVGHHGGCQCGPCALPQAIARGRGASKVTAADCQGGSMSERLAAHAVRCPQCQNAALRAATDLEHGIECGFIGDPKQPDVCIELPDVCGAILRRGVTDEHGHES